MKRNQVTAILLSVIMAVSTCMPGNVISALAAENAGTQSTEAAAEAEEPADETQAPAQEETDAESLPGSGEDEEAEKEDDSVEEEQDEADAPDEADAADTSDAEDAADASDTSDAADAAGASDASDAADAAEPEEDAASEKDVKEEADIQEEAEQEVSGVKGAKGGSDIGMEESGFYVEGPEVQYLDAPYGRECTLSVYAQASEGEITYAWFNDYTDESLNCTQSDYTFIPQDSTLIRCEVRNGGEVQYRFFDVNVVPYDNHLVVLPANEGDVYDNTVSLSVDVGDSLTLRVNVSADDMSQLQYAWQYYDENAEDEYGNPGAFVTIPGEETEEYEIPAAGIYNNYRCVVTDQYNNIEEAKFYLYFNNHLIVYPEGAEWEGSQSANLYAVPGNPFTLRVIVSANDTDQLQYEWTKSETYLDENNQTQWHNVRIEEATTAEYTIPAVTKYTEYHCNITDPYGDNEWVYFYVYADNQLTIEPEDGNSEFYVAVGEPVTLRAAVSAVDDSQLTFTWAKYVEYSDNGEYNSDYITIEGEETEEYTIPAVTEEATYVCTVRDQYGNSKEAWFHVYVENYLKAYPEGVENEEDYVYFYVSPGSQLTLRTIASAADDSQLQYKWYRYENYEGEDWGDYVEIEGAGTAEYAIPSVTKSEDYQCNVSDQYGSRVSVYFHIRVETHLEVERVGDYEWDVVPGETVTLQVQASADEGVELSYHWHSSIENWNPESTDTDTVTFTPGSSGYVYCEVSDGYGNTESQGFYVYLDNHLTVYPEGAENEDDSTVYIYVSEGSPATLRAIVSASDMSQLQYRWTRYQRVADEEGSFWWNSVSSEVTESPEYSVASVETCERYQCIVSDQYGNERDADFYVSVETHLVASAVGDTEKYVAPGETVTLQVQATADSGVGLHYRWHSSYSEYWNPEGAATDTVTFTQLGQYNEYYCVVSDDYGNSKTVYFTVYASNQLKAWPEGYEEGVDTADLYVSAGSPATLRVIATAADPIGLQYQWYKGELVEDEWGDSWTEYYPIEGAETSEYTTGPVTKADKYQCRVSDQYDNSKYVYFNVYVETHFTAHSVGSTYRYVSPGETVTLQVQASADDGIEIHYHWYNDDDLNWEPEGTGTDTITFEVQKNCTVYCEVSDDYGNSEEIEYHIYVENQLKVYPEGYDEYEDTAYISVSAGSPATLRVIATAVDTSQLQYEWEQFARVDHEDGYSWFDPIAIPGAETAEYTVPSVTSYRRYICTVSDQYGNSESVDFYVGVDSHLTVNRIGDYYRSVAPNEPVTLQVQASADEGVGIYYHWYSYDDYDWVPEEGADTASVTFVPKQSRFEYTCVVRDDYGNEERVEFGIYIDNQLKAWPEGAESEEENYVTLKVAPGSALTLRTIVTAVDASQLTYRWGRYEQEDEFEDWGWYEDIDGAVTAEYTIASVQKSERYRFTVSDQYGNASNAYFYVDVETHLTVQRIGDVERHVAPGETVTLQVQATADEGVELSYTWRKGYDYGWNATGAGTDTVTFVPDHGSDTYECKVSDNYGNKVYVTFYVYVENQLNAWPDGKGENDSSARIEPVYGEPVTLRVNVSAIDNSQITYRWYVDGDRINGADTAEYVIGSATTAHTYRCAVEDQYYSYDSVTFYIVFDNHLKAYPEGHRNKSHLELSAAPHASVTLSVVVEADDTSQMTYEWDGPNGTIEGADTGSYTISSLERSVYYECCVTDRFGNSREVSFRVKVDNGFVAYPEGGQEDDNSIDVYVPYGQPATLRVIASALEEDSLTFRWKDDNYNTVAGATGKEYTVSSVTRQMEYTCIVKDPYGNEKYIYFELHVENHLNVYPEGMPGRDTAYLYVRPDERVTLHAVIEADDQEGMTISWYNDEWESTIPGGDTREVYGEPTEYSCSVQDKYGNSKTIYFVLRVENGFTAYPAGAEMDQYGEYRKDVHLYPAAGEELDLTVIATSDQGTLRYFWYRSKNIATSWGEYESQYVSMPEEAVAETRHVTATKKTVYRCRVRDDYGNDEEVFFYIHLGGIYAYPEGNEGTQNNRISIVAAQNEEKTLRVITTGAEGSQLTYKWTEGPLNDSGWWPFEQGEGSTTNELVIHPDESRRYLCVVTDQYDNQAMVYFYVNVNGMTISTNQGAPKLTGDNRYEVTVNAAAGESVTLESIVETEQTEPLYFTWEYDDPDRGRTEMDGETGSSVTVTAGESRFYVNTIEDRSGNKAEVWYYFVIDNQLVVYPEGASAGTDWVDVHTQLDEQVTLRPIVSATDLTGIECQWEDSAGRDLGYGEEIKVTATGENTYTCRVTDRFGNRKTVRFHLTFSEQKNLKNAVITLSESVYTYDGSEKKPAVTVTYQDTKLTEGTDYTVAYSDNVNAGQAKVTVTAAGEYVGSKEKTFTIRKADQTLAVPHSELTIIAGSNEMIGVTGNVTALSYSSSDEDIATVDANGKITAVAMGTAVITATAAEDENHNAASVTVNVTVVVALSQEMITVRDVVYNGMVRKPLVKVEYDGSVLTEGTDYTVTCGQNIDAGEYPVVIGGTGRFAGAVQLMYKILQAEQTISAEDMALRPYESVKAQVSGAEGELSYETDAPSVATVTEDGTVTAVAMGTATITVNAAATTNYKAASTTFSVDVTPYNLSIIECEAALAETTLVYNGEQLKPAIAYVKIGDVTLTEGKDYTVTYENNVNVGTGDVIISGNDTTSVGSRLLTFSIVKAEQPLAVAQDHLTIVTGNSGQIGVSGNVNNLTYSSSNEEIATVDQNGLVTAVAEGTAVITVTAAESANYNAASLTVEVEVKGNLQPQEIDCDTSTAVVMAKTKAYTVTGAQGELTFEIADTTVATVASVNDAKVSIKGIKPGITKLIVKAAAADGYEAAEKEFEIRVVPGATRQVRATNLADCMKITWEKVDGATKYDIYRDGELIVSTSNLYCPDKDARYKNLQKFTYKVVAYTTVNKVKLESTEARTTTYYRVMTVGVSNLSNPQAGKLKVTYTTNPKSTGYVVRYGQKADLSDGKTKTVFGAGTNSYTISGVKKGTTYYVQVRTFYRKDNVDYFSTYSTIQHIKITK